VRRFGVLALAALVVLAASLPRTRPSQWRIGVSVSTGLCNLTATVTNTTGAPVMAQIELEVDSQTAKVFQQFWDGHTVGTGETKTYSTVWNASGATPGTYSLKVGEFSPVGDPLWAAWNDSAGTFTVPCSA